MEPLSRIDEYTPWYAKAISAQRGFGEFGGEGESYLSFLTEACKPCIDKKYRTDSRRESTGIIGFSLGGLISLYAAYLSPYLFGKIGCLSASFWHEGMLGFMRRQNMHHPGMRIYMDVGSEEGTNKTTIQKEMVAMTKEAWRILSASGFTPQQLTLFVEEGAVHHAEYAARRFPGALQWLWKEKEE